MGRVTAGGDRTLDESMREHDGLAIMWARKHAASGADLDDLIQDARLGLLRALGRYRSDGGAAFSTYASYWIRNALLRGTAAHLGGLSASEEAQILGRQLRTALANEGMTLREAAEANGIDEVSAARLVDLHHTSQVDELNLTDEHHDPEVETVGRILAEEVRQAIAALDTTARRLIALRYGFHRPPASRSVIERELNLTAREQKRIEVQAITQLRMALGEGRELLAR